MNKEVIVQDILTLDQYVDGIKSKKYYHNELPREIQSNVSIVRAEIAAGIRRFERRGYDVIRNRFFVEEFYKFKNFLGGVIDKKSLATFDNFDEYFDYLNGDIY